MLFLRERLHTECVLLGAAPVNSGERLYISQRFIVVCVWMTRCTNTEDPWIYDANTHTHGHVYARTHARTEIHTHTHRPLYSAHMAGFM